jgi:uncharacterized coiled-coil DUF342 family protein
MKYLLAIALTLPLIAEDVAPPATVEQLHAKVAEQSKQLAEQGKQIAEQAAELRLYQQGLFQCQAAQIHAQAVTQADAQSKQAKEKAKP